METITLTFGDMAENHVGMEQIGSLSSEGFSYTDMLNIQNKLNSSVNSELIDLKSLYNFSDDSQRTQDAYLLIIRNGLSLFSDKDKVKEELLNQSWDTKYWDTRRKKVLNKNARWNVCFNDEGSSCDYENGKGNVIAWKEVPHSQKLNDGLKSFLQDDNLVCEGNYYYNNSKCGIGWHGDAERRKVVGFRLGGTMPLKFNWFSKFKSVGETFSIDLEHGDMYIMSEKATGYDWKKSSIYTLRHSAGCNKYTKLSK